MSNRFYGSQKYAQLFELLSQVEQAAENALNSPNAWLFGLSHIMRAYNKGLDAFESCCDDLNDEQTGELVNLLDDIEYNIRLSHERNLSKSCRAIQN